jgi:hypothetical protein
MAGLDPATHAAPHRRPTCFGTVPDWRDQRLTEAEWVELAGL